MHRPASTIVEHSFFRRVDARTKLALSLAASLVVALPLPSVALCVTAYGALVVAGGLTAPAWRNVRRLRLVLSALFLLDWYWVGLSFAVLITLRLLVLSVAFTVLIATTTRDDMRRALEQLGLPRRVAFAFATALATLSLLEAEWRGILEAQRARGLTLAAAPGVTWRQSFRFAHDLVPFVVPAVVLTTQRAWSLTETAAMRGIEAPRVGSGPSPKLAPLDGAILAAVGALNLLLFAIG
jgi:energy-coupling factor transporter transmembrane protein EcfT